MEKKEAALLYDIRTKDIHKDLSAICKLIVPFDILEIGCGTGRVLKALHNAGCKTLMGIEVDKEKAKIAKNRFTKFKIVKIITEDFLKTKINVKFSRILFAFNVLSEFVTIEKRISALKLAKSLLKADGQIVIISFMHDFEDYSKKQKIHNFEITYKKRWHVEIRCKRNQINQVSKCRVIYSDKIGHSFVDKYAVALLTRNELLTLYKAAELKLIKEFGDYDLSKISCSSKLMIHVLG